jgi:hypothetical protein
MKNFEKIKYPFFGLYKKPERVSFTLDKIFLNRTLSSHKETVDDKSLRGDYFARLLQLDKRVEFDCTCKDLQQLIYQRPKWGMDATATPFDLSEVNQHRAIKLPVARVRDNLVWFKKISYPFTIPSNDELTMLKDIFGILVSINNEWYIKKFTYDSTPIKEKITL